MRINSDKLHFTKTERIFVRICKELKIPFKTKVKLSGFEIDFIIGKYAIEINGHEQNYKKNELLVKNNLIPIHFSNKEILNDRNKIKQIINKCL